MDAQLRYVEISLVEFWDFQQEGRTFDSTGTKGEGTFLHTPMDRGGWENGSCHPELQEEGSVSSGKVTLYGRVG